MIADVMNFLAFGDYKLIMLTLAVEYVVDTAVTARALLVCLCPAAWRCYLSLIEVLPLLSLVSHCFHDSRTTLYPIIPNHFDRNISSRA
jgi:hypothetical protein